MNFIKSFNEFINENKKWIQKSHIKKGGLHKMLGYSEDEKIPDGIIKQIVDKEVGSEIEVKGKKHKVTALMKKRANLAKTLKKL